ncbi:MAG: hypothetical protein J6A21_02860 [Lentisphaeria bacterium]|nr:hypothetical protein [Lentisphaeria bacterium]
MMKNFWNHPVVSLRSMPFWCVANPLSDPFGGPVLPKEDSLQTARLLARAKEENLIDGAAFHDDDLVPWDPEHLEDDLDPRSATYAKLREIKAILDNSGVVMNSAVCNLHGNSMFRNGGLCNPDPKIRALAVSKVKRTLRMGQFFGVQYYIYWVARDGFEVPAAVEWDKVYDYLAQGLNSARSYIAERKMTNYLAATVEPKPNEPRGHMFLPTAGHAVGFICSKLEDPDFWGVNPELLQHEGMALMDSGLTAAYLVAMNKLKFLHFGSQIKAQFDDDFPPLAGPEGLKETVMLFHTLKKLSWRGPVEFDCHMLRAEADPEHAEECRYAFIRNCSEALDIALALADRIRDTHDGMKSQTAADLASIREMCNL